jgi:Cysteine rich repeat
VAIIRAAAVRKACRADVKQLCAEVKPGKGAIAECMKSHAADINDGCKEALAKAEAGNK